MMILLGSLTMIFFLIWMVSGEPCFSNGFIRSILLPDNEPFYKLGGNKLFHDYYLDEPARIDKLAASLWRRLEWKRIR